MIARRLLVWVVLAGLAASPVYAAPPAFKKPDPVSLLPLFSNATPDALAGSIRGYLVRSMPDPLYEASPGWGNTKQVAHGYKWKGQGLNVHAEAVHVTRNHGHWSKIRLSAENVANSLVFDLRDPKEVEPGKVTFTAFLAFDARIDAVRQNWDKGLKLYDASLRAHLRLKLTMHCEATARLEPNGQLLPDAVFRLRVMHADLQYDNFKVEHIAGLGGEAARLLGDATREGIHERHPNLEPELLAKAGAAIEKAADTKEVRINLYELFKNKGRIPIPKNAPSPEKTK